MKKLTLPFILLFALSACDSRDFDSDTFAQANFAKYDVAYEVVGTYSFCSISFVGANKELETINTSLPWSKETFSVSVRGSQELFNASVSATCRDENRLGKSTVSVFIDGEMKSRGATTGYDKTAKAEFVLLAPQNS
jgi:hypothetical protein